MAPPQHITSNATLHALTERLASHSRSLSPLISSNFASSFSPHTLAAAASAYRQPAPPPQLPTLQLVGRHQDPPAGKGKAENGHVRCPVHRAWPSRGEHSEVRCARCGEEEMEGFVWDMGVVLRREFDCWVEQCWAEAFHHVFTHTLPTLLIHLILTGASPTFLRRSIVHGGAALDDLFQQQMLDILFSELELRLSGSRQPEGSSSKTSSPTSPTSAASQLSAPLSRDGVCFHSVSYDHGQPIEEDDHGPCLCQLTACLGCFRVHAENRKGPVSPLPLELEGTAVSMGWVGLIETPDQQRVRLEGLRPLRVERAVIPEGRGFVKNPRPTTNGHIRPPAIFPHPQMTDVLAVEEHLRWRLKEMGASDPAVESRYGPSTNSPAALEGIDMPEEASEDGSADTGGVAVGGGGGKGSRGGGKMLKITRGKGKVRRVVNGTVPKKTTQLDGKDGGKAKLCYLPKEWTNEEATVRNTAIVLTLRHFVKLLHQIAVAVSPFSYPGYSRDVDELERVHPIALYRRLSEPSVIRRRNGKETRAWVECMDKWAEELGVREKTQGNKLVNDGRQAEAVEYYTRAISLDSKKTIYFSNRAVALNTLGYHERAEADCKHILSKDGKNGKAFYQRALARKGMGRWREAEADLREVLRFQPGNESAKRLMSSVKTEVAKLPKQSARDAMDF